MERGQNMELWASGAHPRWAPGALREHSSAWCFLGARRLGYISTCDGR